MSIPAPKNFSPAAVSELNRLIVADLDEGLVLDAAALVVQGAGRQRRLLHQARRRGVFQDDLGKAIVALGGVPAKRGSYRAKVSGAARRFRQILTGDHQGDAYAACARATGRTSDAYARALRSTLPADVRFGIERELSEIEWDRLELNRLRFGALPAAGPARAGAENGEALLRSQRNDERTFEAWSDEGGAASRG